MEKKTILCVGLRVKLDKHQAKGVSIASLQMYEIISTMR